MVVLCLMGSVLPGLHVHHIASAQFSTCNVLKNCLHTNKHAVVPLMSDHKKSPQKTVSHKGFALFGG